MRNREALTFIVGVLAAAIVGFVVMGLLFPESAPAQWLQGAGVLMDQDPAVIPSDRITPDPAIPQGMGLEGGPTAAADVYASTEAALCPACWILTHYSRDRPGAGLHSAEEGAAIQAAVWSFTSGFQPAWDPEHWCGRRQVYDRAEEIMAAAQGQCLPLPANSGLTTRSDPTPVGQAADLVAIVTDPLGRPLADQTVEFGTTLGRLDATTARTDAKGVAAEIDNLGFNLYRSPGADGPWTQLNEALIPSRSPGNQSGAASGAAYEWVDSAISPGKPYYDLLESVDVHGSAAQHGPIPAR